MQLKPTRLTDLLVLAACTAVLAWVATRLTYSHLPTISLFAGASLLPVALVEAGLAFMVRSRLQDHGIGMSRHQLHPITVARAVALAKASMLVGALATGVWLGFLSWILPQQSTLTAAADDLPGALVGVLGGAALVAAAWWLEYCCRAPDEPPEESATS